MAQNTADIQELKQALSESATKWNFNDEQLVDKSTMERLAISTFFKQLNESNVGSIVFVDQNGKKKTYEVNDGSRAYSEFKKDFRESTASVKKGSSFKLKIESTNDDIKGWDGFNYSDFGSSEWVSRINESTTKRVITFKASIGDNVKRKTPANESSKEVVKNEVVESNSNSNKSEKAVNESFELEDLSQIDAANQMKSLLDSMKKFDFSQETKVEDNLVDQTMVGGTSVIKEADGDDAGEGDDAGGGGGEEADPFADAGGEGDDAGGDAGGEADPFADDGGDDGGDAGGDDAGGDAGGEADPFADDGGEGDDDGGDAGSESDAGSEGGGSEDANGEPAPDSAINTDAQGNPKSQYNINVTRPFNSDDSFNLNEEEQKEFFGKIDQLVKIPDMDNYALYLYQITPENVNLDDVHYITSLYELSVKLGLLEDIYADSNLLEKYSSYKYSVVKDGSEQNEDSLEFTEGESKNNPRWQLMESSDKKNKKKRDGKETNSGNPPVQKDNKDKNKKSKKMSSKDEDDRRGPKNMELDKDENGADKPTIIDTTKDGWDKDNKDDARFSETEQGEFHGLGWIVTFKAMQFGSPRYMSMYIKKNGDDKAETQCKNYLEKLSYSEIEIVNIDEIDPYEYVYRQNCSGMKTVEELRTAKYANKAYNESKKKDVDVGTKVVFTSADSKNVNSYRGIVSSIKPNGCEIEMDGSGDIVFKKFADFKVATSDDWDYSISGKKQDVCESKEPTSIPSDVKRDIKRVVTALNTEIRTTKQFNFIKECGVEKPQMNKESFLSCYSTAKVDETVGDTTYKFILRKNDSMESRMFFSNLKEKLFKYLGTFATKYGMECGCEATPTMVTISFMRSNLSPMGYDLNTMVDSKEVPTLDQALEMAKN